MKSLPKRTQAEIAAQVRNFANEGSVLGFPSIVKTPEVCGGDARLIRTRIPVWVLQRYRELGTSEEKLLASYPSLRSVDLTQAWSYADSHREEIQQAIHENECDDDEEELS